MTRVTHNIENGQANGVTVTTTNSAGNNEDPFDAANKGNNAVLAYAASSGIFSHGVTCIQFSTAGSTVNAVVEYTTTIGTVTTDIYGRAKLYVTGASTGNPLRFVRVRNGTTLAGAINVNNATRKIALLDASNTVRATSNTQITYSSPFRLEWHMSTSAGGTLECKIFLNENSTSETEMVSFTGFSLGATFNDYQLGVTSNIPNQPTSYMDELGWSTDGWMGPANQSSAMVDPGFPAFNPTLVTRIGPAGGSTTVTSVVVTPGRAAVPPVMVLRAPAVAGGSFVIGQATSGTSDPSSLLRTTSYVNLAAEMTSMTTAANTNGNADMMALHYKHAFGSGSKSYPMGTPTISGGLTFAKRLTNRGVNAGNYRNGSYVSQAQGTGDWNWAEATQIETDSPLSINNYWPGNYGRLSDDNTATAGKLNIAMSASALTVSINSNANFAPARSTLQNAITATQTSISLTDRTFGNLGLTFTGSELDDFPATGSGNYTITIGTEEMTVTGRVGGTCTVVRGANGTTAAIQAQGATVWLERVPVTIWNPAYDRQTWPYCISRGTAAAGQTHSINTVDFASWIRIDDELMKVVGATTSPGGIQLALVRNLWSTGAAAHAAGARVYSPTYIGSNNAAPSDAGLSGIPKYNNNQNPIRYALKVWQQGAIDFIKNRVNSTLNDDTVFEGGNLVHWDVSSNNMYNNADAWGHTIQGWDDQNTTKLTLASWNAKQKAKFLGLRSYFPTPPAGPNNGVWFMANNVNRPNDAVLIADLLGNDSIDGAYLENWLLNATMGTWINTMNHAIGLLNSDLRALFWPRSNKDPSPVPFMKFCYASLLLINPVGKKCQFVKTMTTPTAPEEVFLWNLGVATGTAPTSISALNIAGTNLYQRTYSNGLIIVNPGTSQQTRALGASYYDITNTTGGAPATVTSVTINPGQAVFLLTVQVGSLACVLKTTPVVPALAITPPPTDVLGNPIDPTVVLGANVVTCKQTLSFRNGDLNPCSFDINDGPWESRMVMASSTVTSSSGGGTLTADGLGVMVLAVPSFNGVIVEAPTIRYHPARYRPLTIRAARYRPITDKKARFDP